MVPVQVLHETALVTVGIAYLHLPALGNPGDARIRDERVALLCFERDAGRCHRQLVSDQLLGRDPRLAVRHL